MRVSFGVLFVCTGNICRSPTAERVMAHRIGPGSEVAVSSAGTHALVGNPIDAPTALALRGLGAEADGHVARQLTVALVEEADLILTATIEQRDFVTRMVPDAAERAYTMREFASVGALVAEVQAYRPRRTADELRERVSHVSLQRGHIDAPVTSASNIADPFGAGLTAARETAAIVSAVVDQDLAALGLPGVRKHPLRRSDRRMADRTATSHQTPG